MKLKYILLLLFLFGCVSSFYLFKTNNWIELRESAHQVGFCIYKIDEPFCEKHSQVDSTTRLPRVFPLEQEWASERLKGWTSIQNRKVENGLILFDLVQENAHSFDSFLIVNLPVTYLDSTQIKLQNKVIYLKIKGNKMVYCTMWREFGTGRGGALVEEIDIKFRNNTVEEVKNFIRELDIYQKSTSKK